jgi:glycosyltransferase involved in cell wall biosynthesis
MRLYLAPFLDALLDTDQSPPMVLDADDLDAELHRTHGDETESESYQRLEEYYLPKMDAVFTAAPDDASRLERRYTLRCACAVPNAVRPPATRARARGPRTHDLVFVGNLSYGPNADAAEWLCINVRPLLPGVAIALVGSNPPPRVVALADLPRITVAADVPDVAPWYDAAAVAVAPMLAGAGTRIKILEALAHGLPVVSTSLGARGLGRIAAEGVLCADGAAGFAAACRRLLDDAALARRLSTRGQQLVRETATVDVVAAQIDTLTRYILAA